MTINKTTNNGINGFQIIDESTEYFIPAETEQEAINKYIAIKNTPVYVEPEYIRLRREAHLPIQEQLDMQYWDMVNGTTKWKDYVASIKANIPKPEGI